MKLICYLAICILFASASIAQSPKRVIKKLGDHPIFFIDSINVDETELQNYEPAEIAQVTVFKGKEAVALAGDDGKDGVIYIFTKKYAKTKYWQYFQTKSNDYKKLVVSPESDTTIQYVLNKKVLKDNFEGDLFLIDDEIFKSIRLLDKETLEKEFNVTDKTIGFQITSEVPDKLYKGKKKF